MKLAIRLAVFALIVAGAIASSASQKSEPVPSRQIVSASMPVPTCSPFAHSKCGLK